MGNSTEVTEIFVRPDIGFLYVCVKLGQLYRKAHRYGIFNRTCWFDVVFILVSQNRQPYYLCPCVWGLYGSSLCRKKSGIRREIDAQFSHGFSWMMK